MLRFPRTLFPTIAVVLLISLLPAACTGPASGRPPAMKQARLLMGTLVEITADGVDATAASAAIDAAYARMAELADMLHHGNPDSVVAAINRQAGVAPVALPREAFELLRMAQTVAQRSEGAFDVTVGALRGWHFDTADPAWPQQEAIRAQLPLVDYRGLWLDASRRTALLRRRGMAIDLGGIAKLYIVAAGMDTLRARGVRRAMINAGGDIQVMDLDHGRPWRIGIRHPRDRRGFASIDLENGFVVSSGDYERYFIKGGRRYHHILDPRTGVPATGPAQVTLVGTALTDINGYSLAIMVRGRAWGKALLATVPGLDGVIVAGNGSAWVSPALRTRLRCWSPTCGTAVRHP